MVRKAVVLCVFFVGVFATACAMPVEEVTEEAAWSPQVLAELISEHGLKCEYQRAMFDFSETELFELQSSLVDMVGHDELLNITEERETCIGDEEPIEDGVFRSAITSTYTVEWIEESSGTGGRTPLILRDAASLGWMCNPGGASATWYDPADYVVQVNVPGAYSNLGRLRARGTNWFATRALDSSSPARVYSDNDIRMCVGYYRVFAWAMVLLPSDVRIWLNP